MSLNATIQNLRNKENDQDAARKDRDAFITKWRIDVYAVYAMFVKAMKPFEDDGAVKITRGQTTVSEELLGEYEIDTLAIEVINRRVLLVPIARITLGGTGRLDLFREDRPSESNRILLVRGSSAVGHDPDTWLIQDRSKDLRLSDTLMTGLSLINRAGRTYTHLDERTIQEGIDYVLNI